MKSLFEADTVFATIDFVLLRHCQFLWCHKMECRIEVAHGSDERVHGASVLQVANEIDIKVFESALCFVDGIKIEETL